MTNVYFDGCSRTAVSLPVFTWNKNSVLAINGLNLPATTEVHFSDSEHVGEALTVIAVTVDGRTLAKIPNEFLKDANSDVSLWAFVYVTDGEVSETLYKIRIPVVARPKPVDYTPTEEEVSQIAELLDSINEKYESLDTAMTDFPSIKAELDAYITEKREELKGEKGDKGDKGDAGKDGTVTDEEKEAIAQGVLAKVSESVQEEVNAISDRVKALEDNPVVAEETDPTVPAWAKQPSKPTYTASEVGALPSNTVIPPDLTERVEALEERPSGSATDVQINGTSITQNGVANIPYANSTNAGAIKVVNYTHGLRVDASGSAEGQLRVYPAEDGDIRTRTNVFRPIVPANIDRAVKYALSDCKLTGNNAWSEDEKASAKELLGVTDGITLDDIPKASMSEFGLFKPYAGSAVYGLYSAENGTYVYQASDNMINAKENKYCPITPKNLDYAVKKSLSDSKVEWTDSEKTNAKTLLGVTDDYFNGLIDEKLTPLETLSAQILEVL